MSPEAQAFEFAKALLNPQLKKPPLASGPNGKAAVKRFNVYRNNVAVGLVEALGKNYPAVKALCGEAKFNDAAHLYLNAMPPKTRLMFELGQSFPEWLNEFAPAQQQMPWLTDLAKLERCWLQSYHAGDILPFDPLLLEAVVPENLGSIRFRKHTAANIIVSDFAIFDLLESGRNHIQCPIPHTPQNVLVTRPHLDVEVRHLPLGIALFLTALFSGTALIDAAETALQYDAEFELSSGLAVLLQSGAVSGMIGKGTSK